MFVTVLVILVVLWVGALVYAATRPDTVLIQSGMTINASPETIFPLVSDFRNWPRWSPFEQLDPAMRRAHSGDVGSVGAKYFWEGNFKAGSGRMEIFDVKPPVYVMISVDFLRPFQAHNMNLFALEPRGEGTRVTWIMDGKRPYILRLISAFMITDKRLAKYFAAGLARLKDVAEAAA